MIALTRRYGFPAAHVLRHPAFDEARNRRVYGQCANLAGHGHDYGLEITVTGPVDPASGQLVDRQALDGVVRERVLERFGSRLLNEDPAFAECVPTAENIASVIHEELSQPLRTRCGARLVRVRLRETRKNSFSIGELS